MYCKYCGCENTDGSSFCQHCGRRIDSDQNGPWAAPGDGEYNNYQYRRRETEQNTYSGPDSDGYYGGYRQTDENTYYGSYQPGADAAFAQGFQEAPAAACVRKSAASPLFLIGIIFCSVVVFLSIISSFFTGSLMDSFFNGVYGGMGEAVSTSPVLTVFSALLSCVPQLLIVIGLWMVYAAAADKKNPFMKTSGFTLLKVMFIVEIVLLCIALCVIALVCIVVTAVSRLYVSQQDEALLLVVFAAVFAVSGIVFFILALLFYVKCIGALAAHRQTIQDGMPRNISAYIPVFSYIVVACDIILALELLLTGYFFSGIIEVMSAAAYVFFALSAGSFRREMKAFYAKVER